MKIQNKTFDEERALYKFSNGQVQNCTFSGPADGESALKETQNVVVDNCNFFLRYPLWHCRNFSADNCTFHETSRAPLWYDNDGILNHCKIVSIKPLRECTSIAVNNCTIAATETGWKCNGLNFLGGSVDSEYFLLDSQNVQIDGLQMHGKYSFQYANNCLVENSVLNTKDAFWHANNVVVKNCKVIGEYLGWYSQNLTFIDCEIVGTQPLCYCKNLTLTNCTMTDCDLSFEYSDVQAQINGFVTSIKNPLSGKIVVDSVGEIVLKDAVYDNHCEIVVKNK